MTSHGKVYLACIGDVNDRNTWSGTPFHFLEAAKRAQFIDEGITLNPHFPHFRRDRLIWNVARILSGHGAGGFQYSSRFLDALWHPIMSKIRAATVINHFQLYPPSVVADRSISKWYYIDGTLKQLFDYYGSSVQKRRAHEEFIGLEKAGYQAAEKIVTMSRFAADSVIHDYGIPSERVDVVIPGANILPTEYMAWEAEARPLREKQAEEKSDDVPLQMVFIGKAWERKGLDRLLRALKIARASGARATLRVIGCAPASLPAELRRTEGVEWYGFISRRHEPQRFLKAVTECNVGCLLSRAEFSSIALREFLCFGMAVIGPRTGGCPELIEPDASILIDPDASDESLAGEILRLAKEPNLLSRLTAAAWRLRRTALWDRSVEKFKQI